MPDPRPTSPPPAAPRRLDLLLNALIFQAGWFVAVLGAARSGAAWGVAAGVLGVAWHLWRAPQRGVEARVIGLGLLAGALFETLLSASGSIVYQAGWPGGIGPPPWMLGLWALLATTLNSSLRWLQGRPWLAAALGGFGAPFSYLSGGRLGAAQLLHPALAVAIIAAGWALLTPALLAAAARLRRPTPRQDTM